jgi:hypothetical protein
VISLCDWSGIARSERAKLIEARAVNADDNG